MIYSLFVILKWMEIFHTSHEIASMSARYTTATAAATPTKFMAKKELVQTRLNRSMFNFPRRRLGGLSHRHIAKPQKVSFSWLLGRCLQGPRACITKALHAHLSK